MRLMILTVLAVALGNPHSAVPVQARPATPPTRLVTDRDRYVANGVPDEVELEIGLTYTNHSKTPQFFPGCREPSPPVLEKQMNGVWSLVYAPIVKTCKGPTRMVAPGETYAFAYRVIGSLAGSFEPAFDVETVPGVYRVRWPVYRKQIAEPLGTREEDPENVFSNSFTVLGGGE